MRWTNFLLGGSLWLPCLGPAYASVLTKSDFVRRQSPPGSFVFRGDHRSPREIRSTGGFQPQGDGWENHDSSFNLERHYTAGPNGCGLNTDEDDNFVFRTAYVSAALNRDTAELYGQWLYEIRATPNILHDDHAESEVMALGGIHWRQIRRYTRMRNGGDRVHEQHWIDNPEYDAGTYDHGPHASACRVEDIFPGVLVGDSESDSDSDSDSGSDMDMDVDPADDGQGPLFAAANRFMDETPRFELYGGFPPTFETYGPRGDIPGPDHPPPPPEEDLDNQAAAMLQNYIDIGAQGIHFLFPNVDDVLRPLLNANPGACPALRGFGSRFRRSSVGLAQRARRGKHACCKVFKSFRNKLVRERSKHGACRVKPLAEILWIMMNNIDDEDPGDLYGSVNVTDKLGAQVIYNVEEAHPVSVAPRDMLQLNRSRPIAADKDFTIKLDLWDQDTISSNDEVSRGEVSWTASDNNNQYDKVMTKEVQGSDGRATVQYIVIRNAIKAVVEIILVDGDKEDPADVFGKVSVSSRFIQRDIFEKRGGKHISVHQGKAIPLSQATFAIPMDDTLTVHVDLWDHDSDPSPNDEIARSSAQFRPQRSGTTFKTVEGEYGQVNVTVTWGEDKSEGC